ncbi:endonuclease [Vibrio sp. TBV020]|uniref:endonuclease n=1 Tax=Vibrio sp. TBV020 TaxID=3137398 RepID=UPI0038CDA546
MLIVNKLSIGLLVLISGSVIAQPTGNTTIASFSTAKKIMQKQIYTTTEQRKTLYCGATFNSKKQLILPTGFKTNKYKNRLKRWEAEHVVPAENFGRTFIEWREGHPQCIDNKGKAFKGRKCAEKVNTEYRLMQSDLYNLVPAIGSVNASRQNYNFTMLPHAASDFGQCDVRIDNRKVQPPEQARGQIARTYLYFEAVYPRYSMSKAQRQLMQAWDKQYPVTKVECQRAQRIEKQQGNTNPILATRCN